MARGNTEFLREHLMAVLASARGALTTSQLQHQLSRVVPAVALYNESVYRNLLVLEHRRKVRRCRQPGRHVAWEVRPTGTVEAAICRVNTTHRPGCDGKACLGHVLNN